MGRDLRVLMAAAAGGVAGYLLFFWLVARGYYGPAVPGGLLGLGAGIFTRRSGVTPIVCAVAAAALGLFTAWRYAPFIVDPSLGFFLIHVGGLPPVSLVMIALGALIGFWVPFRRHRKESAA